MSKCRGRKYLRALRRVFQKIVVDISAKLILGSFQVRSAVKSVPASFVWRCEGEHAAVSLARSVPLADMSHDGHL